MGIIENKSFVKISRPKLYILKYNDYSRINDTGGHEFIMGYFTSKENADNHVKQLIEKGKLVAIKIGVNKFGDDIIRYAPITKYGNIDIKNTINLVIEEHEMDLDVDEISYYGIKHPDIEPEVEMTLDS